MNAAPREAPADQSAGASALAAGLAALSFLTVLPVPRTRPPGARDLGRAVGLFPLVGLLLGGLLASGAALAGLAFPRPVVAALVLALWVILTGAFHLDGFLDACDGLFGGHSPAARLEILRDERIGSFALAGGVLLLLLKWAALAYVPDLCGALLLAPPLGRWVMSLAVVRFPYGRSEGLGLAMKTAASWRQAALATLLAGLVVLGYAYWNGPATPTAALAGAGLAGWGLARWALARLPGLTGDVYGALCELAELAALLALVAVQ